MLAMLPARWTLAHSGTTRSAVSPETPFARTWRSDTGIVADGMTVARQLGRKA